MTSEPKGAILQRDKETYAIVPKTLMGLVTPDILEKIAGVARKYDIPIIKIVAGQRIALVGIKPENVDQVWDELGMEVGKAVGLCLHYIQACPGNAVCRMGILDSLGLGGKLDDLLDKEEYPAKVKMGISGCPLNCGESYVRDVGIFARKEGWTLTFGGNSGSRPRIGDVLAEGLSDDEVMALAQKALTYYKNNAKNRERTARFIDRIGVEEFKKAVLS